MKGKGLAAAVMIACLLTGCVRYDGSRIGNESQLSMEYRKRPAGAILRGRGHHAGQRGKKEGKPSYQAVQTGGEGAGVRDGKSGEWFLFCRD